MGSQGRSRQEPPLGKAGQYQIPGGVISQPRSGGFALLPGSSELPRPNILFLVWRLGELKMHRSAPGKQTLTFPCLCIQDTRPKAAEAACRGASGPP